MVSKTINETSQVTRDENGFIVAKCRNVIMEP